MPPEAPSQGRASQGLFSPIARPRAFTWVTRAATNGAEVVPAGADEEDFLFCAKEQGQRAGSQSNPQRLPDRRKKTKMTGAQGGGHHRAHRRVMNGGFAGEDHLVSG